MNHATLTCDDRYTDASLATAIEAGTSDFKNPYSTKDPAVKKDGATTVAGQTNVSVTGGVVTIATCFAKGGSAPDDCPGAENTVSNTVAVE
jgi:hypothetical protein